MVLAVLSASGCRCEQEDPLHLQDPAPPRAPATGHDRMVVRLAEIAAEARRSNPFFGQAAARSLREAIQSLPARRDPRQEWQLRSYLGLHELRLGNNQEAVKQYEAAVALLGIAKSKGAQIPPDIERQTAFQLGVAYLRLGETQNCVARHTSRSCIWPIEGGGIHVNQAGSRKAIERFTETLRVQPDFLPARWLLHIAAMTVGGYPAEVPVPHRIDPRMLVSDQPFPRFEDIAPRLHLNTFSMLGGAVADDFDNDGLLDVVTSTWDPAGQMRYFHNEGDGSFSERTAEAGLDGIVGGANLVQADYDNDGFTDLLVLRGGWLHQDGRWPNSLLRNTGGRFRDMTFEAGLADVDYPSQTASWGDYDLDGDLDLYVGNEADTSAGQSYPSQLFRNNGDGTFSDVARQAGVENLRFAKGVVFGDYDGDRFPDIYVSNMGGENRLYRNNRDGTFSDEAPRLGVTRPISSFPVWFWDFDNDGALDLFASSYYLDMGPYLESLFGKPTQAEPPCLYRGDGHGAFRDEARSHRLTRVHLAMGANFGDLDNDGFLDFYLGTGYPGYEALTPNVMYLNRAGASFADVTAGGGFGHLQKGHGVAFADLDNDGDQDVFEQLGGAYPGDAFGDALFENPGFDAHWIKVKLVGTRSSRSAIGARIRLQISERGRSRSIYRHVNSGGSFGANPLRQEIGVGAARVVDVLEVLWPASDTTQSFRDVAVDQLVQITEGKPELVRVPLKRVDFR